MSSLGVQNMKLKHRAGEGAGGVRKSQPVTSDKPR